MKMLGLLQSVDAVVCLLRQKDAVVCLLCQKDARSLTECRCSRSLCHLRHACVFYVNLPRAHGARGV